MNIFLGSHTTVHFALKNYEKITKLKFFDGLHRLV